MAAGNGSRMKSKLPKMIQPICGRPMVGYVADALRNAGVNNLYTIVPPRSAEIKDSIGFPVTFIEQTYPNGTGGAILSARVLMEKCHGNLLVINGDMPLVTPQTITKLIQQHESTASYISLLTVQPPLSKDMGRIIRDSKNRIVSINESNAVAFNAQISEEGNSGIYCFNLPELWTLLDEIEPVADGEYRITDLVSIAHKKSYEIGSLQIEDPSDLLGVNNGIDLARARTNMQKRINDKWLLEGVIIIEPVYIDVSVELAPDTIIYPNTFIQGNSTIDANCHLGPGSIIKNSVIRENCSIIQSMIEAAVLEQNVAIGPYSHVRPDSYIGQNVHVGNFVEVKNSHIGNNTQMGHFSYIGDATIGNNVNIGAGVVTCNFDGSRKHETIIDDSAFIGSDSMIVAPIHIGAGASTGAGSIVTKDVPPNTFVVGMPARITSKKKTNLDT